MVRGRKVMGKEDLRQLSVNFYRIWVDPRSPSGKTRRRRPTIQGDWENVQQPGDLVMKWIGEGFLNQKKHNANKTISGFGGHYAVRQTEMCLVISR